MRLPALLLTSSLLLAQSTSTIRVTTRLVYVDVVVRDARGHVVTGLPQDDFAITEDGQPQKITLFTPHTPLLAAAPQALPPPDPLHATNRPPGNRSAALNLLLFDLTDTPVLDQPYAREEMIRFLTKLPPGQQIALFVLSDRLHMLQGFTGSSDLLAAAARLIHPKEMALTDSRHQQMRSDEDSAYIAQGEGRGSDTLLGAAIRSAITGKDTQDLKVRSSVVAGAFRDIARAVSGYAGRKDLLWLSGAFPVGLVEQLHTVSTGAPTILANSAAFTSADLARTLADSQVAVYPISVFGVETDTAGAASSGLGTAVAANSGNPVTLNTEASSFAQRQDLHETMNAIADATGGRAIYGTNDLTGALGQILEDGENSYTLAYRPSNPDFTGHPRQIHVSLREKGLTLSYRHSYLATPAPSAPEAQPQVLLRSAMEVGKPTFTALQLSSDVTLPTAGSPHVQVSSQLDAHAITFKLDEAGRRHAQLSVLLAAIAPDADPKKPPPQTSGVLTLNLDPEQYRTLLAEGLRFHQSLALTAGAWSLRLGVMDLGNGQIGTLDLPIRIP